MNFRRRKPRHRTSPRAGRLNCHFLRAHPKWWDVIFHSRPARRRSRSLLRAIMRGADADAAAFDPPRKPHHYYW